MTIHKKRKIYFGLFWLIVGVSFVFFATSLIFMANGYQFNYNTLKLQKTGMVVINGKSSPMILTLNSQEKEINLPVRLSKLFPGPYNLKIQKNDYHDYHKSFQLAGGQAVIVENLTLFLLQPAISNLGPDEKIIAQVKKDNTTQLKGFTVLDNEIIKNEQLVTRFSQPVLAAIYDNATSYYFVQLNNEIHAIYKDGTNDYLLIKLENNQPVTMAINNNNILSYLSGNQVFRAQLW